jgi:adenosylcobinamide-phosphate synthase
MIIVSLLLAILLDIVFSEPKRFHPLVGFGAAANAFESRVNRSIFSPFFQFLLGLVSWVLLVVVPALLIVIAVNYLSFYGDLSIFFDVLFLYLAIGYTSLRQHTVAILKPLAGNNLVLARQKVAWIVSRDTNEMDEVQVRKATIESVLENGSDAIFAPIFWFIVGGLPGVIIYRLANTLDAMWGYKTTRFLYFGGFSARMDDILNYLPSRLVALSYAVLGRFTLAIRCWHQQAHLLASPSGGVVMSAGAGTLNVMLGGDTYYHGQKMDKPTFGCGLPPIDQDISKSLALIDKTVALWCGVVLLGSVAQYFLS